MRGDETFAAPADGTTHSFRVDADAPCVSLLVRDARIVPTTLFGKVFTWLTGA